MDVPHLVVIHGFGVWICGNEMRRWNSGCGSDRFEMN